MGVGFAEAGTLGFTVACAVGVDVSDGPVLGSAVALPLTSGVGIELVVSLGAGVL